MTGQQPKSGIAYEILVAASLSSFPHTDEGISLDLRSFNLNVNPQTFNKNMTSIGFDVTPDLEARLGNLTYILECKSSTTPDEVLKIGSDALLITILEFAAIENFRQNSKWDLRYIMVIDYPVGRDVRNLFHNASETDIEKLRDRLIKFGRNEHSKGFNEEILTSELIINALSRSMIVIQPSQLLDSKYSENPEFRKKCEEYLSQLRNPPSDSIAKKHWIFSQKYKDVIFCCESATHENCDELAEGDLVFHVGNIESFTKNLAEIYDPSLSTPFTLVKLTELDGISKKVEVPENASQKEIAQTLSRMLSISMSKIDKKLIVLVIPGTFDILIGDHARLEKIVKKAHNFAEDKYNLDLIPEFQHLGSIVKVALARQVLRFYDFETTDDNFIANDNMDELS